MSELSDTIMTAIGVASPWMWPAAILTLAFAATSGWSAPPARRDHQRDGPVAGPVDARRSGA